MERAPLIRVKSNDVKTKESRILERATADFSFKKKKKKIDIKNEFVIVASFLAILVHVGPYARDDVWIYADMLEN